MSSNTQIFIKRSEANNTPGSLHTGELAYSYASNTLFIGANTATGAGYYKIGGQYYTNIIDEATSLASANTLVLRDADGSFSVNVITANTVSANVVTANTFYGSLGTTFNITANTYGDQTHIPVITVSANGLITNVSTAEISTSLTVDGDTGGPNTINLLTDTLTIAGGDGLTSNVNGNTITLDVDDTVFRSNTEMPGTSQHIQTDVQISGNLIVQGNLTYVNTSIVQTTDSLIQLASNNTTGDVLDIGFYGLHQNTSTSGVDITGLVRNAGTSDYYLFDRVNIGDETDINANTLAHAFTTANSASLYTNKVLANQSLGYTEGGFSFSGTEGGLDTGMFSPDDGELEFWSQNVRIITANTDIVFFEKDLKLQNAATINNPSGLLELNPDETNEDDRYIVIDPTEPNHIHLRAGGTIDASGADLFLGGEQNYVRVSDGNTNVEIRTNDIYAWQFTNDGKLQLANNTLIYDSADGNDGFYVDPIRANNATGGNVTAYNTTTKELVSTDVKITNAGITLANGTVISDGESGFFVDSLQYDAAPLDVANVVLYNAETGEITYGSLGDVTTVSRLANGSHTWTVSANTGALYSDLGTALACSANSVLLGNNIDYTNDNYGRVAIGLDAGASTQGDGSVAIGQGAGNSGQQYDSVAVGHNAGNVNQHYFATALGYNAGYSEQGTNSVAVGHAAAQHNQGGSSVAVGFAAGNDHQGYQTVAVGRRAGRTYQGDYSTAVGTYAGQDTQNQYAVAVGYQAGQTHQGHGAIAIGDTAGNNYQNTDSIAIGTYAGENSANTNGWAPIAIGRYAGQEYAGSQSVSIGNRAGANNIGYHAVALGHYAGNEGLGDYGIAIGDNAGHTAGEGTIIIGLNAGYQANNYSIAIGHESGYYDGTSGLGDYQIALGYRAAYDHGFDNSIVLNASGSNLSASASGLYVNPIRYTEAQDSTYDGLVFYNSDTKEVRYSYALDGGSF